ncbi:hypothetical protein ACR79S_20305 [Sphingobacterium spiritivorum]|uniref:hypothetical protein n=1 Tax=Sphingobacterium spiritivorum TaxID=258 RepID=UPI003DA1FEF7
MRTIFLITIVNLLFSSCERKEEKKRSNDFSFYLPDADLYITTSKRMEGDFYVMFSKTDSISRLSDSTDYIKCDIEDVPLIIVFDPINKDNIYIKYPYVEKINKKNLNIIKFKKNDFNNKFYHNGIGAGPNTLKNPYKKLYVIPTSYNITFQRDSSFNSQIIIKNGNMWGE